MSTIWHRQFHRPNQPLKDNVVQAFKANQRRRGPIVRTSPRAVAITSTPRTSGTAVKILPLRITRTASAGHGFRIRSGPPTVLLI
jgi:hypothetical protein